MSCKQINQSFRMAVSGCKPNQGDVYEYIPEVLRVSAV